MLFLAALLPQALFDDPGEINAARTALWVLALAVDYGGIMLARRRGLAGLLGRRTGPSGTG